MPATKGERWSGMTNTSSDGRPARPIHNTLCCAASGSTPRRHTRCTATESNTSRKRNVENPSSQPAVIARCKFSLSAHGACAATLVGATERISCLSSAAKDAGRFKSLMAAESCASAMGELSPSRSAAKTNGGCCTTLSWTDLSLTEVLPSAASECRWN